MRRYVLTAHRITGRRRCCQEHIRWRKVRFSDESRFMLFRAYGRSRIYRFYNEHNNANCALEYDRFGGGSVMMCAGIHHNGRTALVRVNGAFNAQIYQNEILQHHVVSLPNNVTGGTVQHDNARLHNARVCRDFLQQNNVHVSLWQARSADLSSTEHI